MRSYVGVGQEVSEVYDVGSDEPTPDGGEVSDDLGDLGSPGRAM
jgi:hypothetical protein